MEYIVTAGGEGRQGKAKREDCGQFGIMALRPIFVRNGCRRLRKGTITNAIRVGSGITSGRGGTSQHVVKV